MLEGENNTKSGDETPRLATMCPSLLQPRTQLPQNLSQPARHIFNVFTEEWWCRSVSICKCTIWNKARTESTPPLTLFLWASVLATKGSLDAFTHGSNKIGDWKNPSLSFLVTDYDFFLQKSRFVLVASHPQNSLWILSHFCSMAGCLLKRTKWETHHSTCLWCWMRCSSTKLVCDCVKNVFLVSSLSLSLSSLVKKNDSTKFSTFFFVSIWQYVTREHNSFRPYLNVCKIEMMQQHGI